MAGSGIPLDKAELLSVLLEALLYGFSLLMFGGTIWTLFFQRSTHNVNRKMLTVACALFLTSTAHLVLHIIRIMEGLILYRDTYPGGPSKFFSNPSHWTFVTKSFVYAVQTLIGDGVILYRCYAVWQSKLIMIIPALLWCALAVTGLVSPYMASRASQSVIFGGRLAEWITAFWAMALACNLFTTAMLAGRIWYVDRKARRLHGHQKSQLRCILRIIIDAGMIYSLSVFVGLVLYVSQSNGQYVILDMVAPIVSITFYMVIIRVGLTKRACQQTMASIPLGYTSAENSISAERRRTLQVHVSKMTESKIDNGQRLPMYPKTVVVGNHERYQSQTPSELGFEGKEEVV